MSEYDDQARNFLEATSTKFMADYLEHAPYFDDDKESRDIWKITLRRKGKSFTFRFGQSIASQGEEPRPYSVLACMTKYDPGTFQNFCDEYGYSTDSIKATRTYKAVVREWKGVDRLFHDVLDQLNEIQ